MEEKIEKCLDKSLKKLEPPVQTVSAETFRNTDFPGMDYLSLPSSPDSILAFLKSPEFVKRLKPLNLHYLLVLQGESNTSPMEAGCEGGGGGMGGGVWVCVFTWDKSTKMSASIIDITKACCAGEVKVEASGTSWIALLSILPIGFPAITEGPACKALGKKVTSFITGNRQSKN